MTAIQRAILFLDQIGKHAVSVTQELTVVNARKIAAELRALPQVDGDLEQIQQALVDWVKRNTTTCTRCGTLILPVPMNLSRDGKGPWRVYTGQLAWSHEWSQFGRDGSSNKRRYCGDCSKRVEQVLDLAESEVDLEA